MLEQEDNKGLDDKIRDALNFLNENIERTQEELDHLIINIECLDENIKEVDNCLNISINSINSNADLFSPSKNNEKNMRCDILKENRISLENEKNKANERLSELLDRKNNFEMLLLCLKQLVNNGNHDIPQINEDPVMNQFVNNQNKALLGINLLETQENDRKRIARDLHDTTAQNLTNIIHKTELCTKLIDIDPIRAKLELQTMISTIKTTIDDMRSIIYNLRPMSIDDLGLIATVERFIKKCNSNDEIEFSLIIHNEEINVLPIINLTLFRIIQEASNNAIKHGKATKIVIELEYIENSILLKITDNGIGFNNEILCNDVDKSILSGFGLSIMKERVLLLSGEIKIESRINSGTKILVEVPVRTFKED